MLLELWNRFYGIINIMFCFRLVPHSMILMMLLYAADDVVCFFPFIICLPLNSPSTKDSNLETTPYREKLNCCCCFYYIESIYVVLYSIRFVLFTYIHLLYIYILSIAVVGVVAGALFNRICC